MEMDKQNDRRMGNAMVWAVKCLELRRLKIKELHNGGSKVSKVHGGKHGLQRLPTLGVLVFGVSPPSWHGRWWPPLVETVGQWKWPWWEFSMSL